MNMNTNTNLNTHTKKYFLSQALIQKKIAFSKQVSVFFPIFSTYRNI